MLWQVADFAFEIGANEKFSVANFYNQIRNCFRLLVLQDLLVPEPSAGPGGPESWLDDDNIAAYEVTDYAAEAEAEDNELLCADDGSPVRLETASNDDEGPENSAELSLGPGSLSGGGGTVLSSSELVLNLPQDAIRIVNDKAGPSGAGGGDNGAFRAGMGLPEEFLSGIVCLCGRGRSGQPSACHQVSQSYVSKFQSLFVSHFYDECINSLE